ncbi:uncharacterized protein [Typha latifolia]|uniref:uncharacterized protein n=1 Tax=Typha latifolia TaxID=4733 RepID=UPI003C2BA402
MAAGMEAFEAYFRKADLDRDGRISGSEAVAFFKGSNLPQQVLAQVWNFADHKRTGYLGREEFYNALKLVTVAQRGHQLTQDIVKSALFGEAAAKIPAPRISYLPSPATSLNTVSIPIASTQVGAIPASAPQTQGFRGQQVIPAAGSNQQFVSTGSHLTGPPQGTLAAASLPTQGIGQKPPLGVGVAGQNPTTLTTPNLSTDWFGGRNLVGGTSQVSTQSVAPPANHENFGLSHLGSAHGGLNKSQGSSISGSSIANSIDIGLPSSQPAAKDSKALVVSGNGFSPKPTFEVGLISATPQAKKDSSSLSYAANSIPNSAAASSTVAASQYPAKPRQFDQFQSLPSLPAGGSQLQQNQSFNVIQSTSVPAVTNIPVGPIVSNSTQTQRPWPKITQSDIQKYTAVFIKVDKDRDGKITGEEARNLFLSWKLPREVLRQVWELSDQDKDSMLTLREFCTAVYLMERSREGHILPSVLPDGIWSDGVSLPSTGQFSATYSGPAWQQSPGLSHPRIPGSRPPIANTSTKLPVQTPMPSETNDTKQPVQQKSKIPVLEKHLVDQLSKEEQSSLNSKFQEAVDAEKKVQELEKEILDSKEKTEYYRTKMQELILYKSRCDNRLNEIMERVSSDKREVQSLAKRYEEKSQQLGGVASRLTIEEATFRDIQERKLELYSAIAKMQKVVGSDDSLQDRANQMQSDLEELVKSLNEQCKLYGLRTKPTSLIELPFGWQLGIQEAAANWDEDWDKFGEDGFTVIKELTVEVENVAPTVKERPPTAESEKMTSNDVPVVAAASNIDSKDEKPSSAEKIPESDTARSDRKDELEKSPPGSPVRSALEHPSDDFQSAQSEIHDTSPRVSESTSDHGAVESSISVDKYADEHLWGPTFDHGDDTDSVWSINTKEADNGKSRHNFYFGSEDLFPIRTDSPTAASVYGKEQKPFFDSVPSTPMYNFGKEQNSFFDSVPSTPMYNSGKEQNSFFDSVPSTPMFNSGKEQNSFFDSVPSTPMYNSGKEQKSFFDSVPSTSMLNSGFSPRFSDGAEDNSFDNFSQFDSFSLHDNNFSTERESFTKFDSFRSTTDYSMGDSFARFDSFASGRGESFARTDSIPSGKSENLARFDSIRSNSDYSKGFFDDADPFGTEPFKSSESHSPRKGTYNWSAF